MHTGVLGPGAVQLTVINGPAGTWAVFPRNPDHRTLLVEPLHVWDATPARLLLQPVPHQHPIFPRRASLVTWRWRHCAERRGLRDGAWPRRPRAVAARDRRLRRAPVFGARVAVRQTGNVALQRRVVADVTVAHEAGSRLRLHRTCCSHVTADNQSVYSVSVTHVNVSRCVLVLRVVQCNVGQLGDVVELFVTLRLCCQTQLLHSELPSRCAYIT